MIVAAFGNTDHFHNEWILAIIVFCFHVRKSDFNDETEFIYLEINTYP